MAEWSEMRCQECEYRCINQIQCRLHEQEILKDIDNAMLWYDLTYLLHEKQPLPKPQVYDEPDYTVRPFTDVEEEYLQIYRTFIQKLH